MIVELSNISDSEKLILPVEGVFSFDEIKPVPFKEQRKVLVKQSIIKASPQKIK